MAAEACYWLVCFVPIAPSTASKIFGFSEFLASVALFVVVYTIADVRYKFRIAVAPCQLYAITFALIGVIGFQTLLTEIWIAENWWVPKTRLLTRSTWQGIFGILFLCTFLTWIYYAFIRPPIFGRNNAFRFAQELYRYILRGNDDELKVVANELARSAKSLVKYCRRLPARGSTDANQNQQAPRKLIAENYAHDIFLLIADRNFCKQIISASPVTAQALFEEIASANKFNIPIGQFARNVSSEAIAQKESILYVETDGYTSGLMGYLKPVSKAIYSNFELVESLAAQGISPLDIYFEEQYSWDAKQWDAYCRATLLTFRGYLTSGRGATHSYAIVRALHSIETSFRDVYELNEATQTSGNDAYSRLDMPLSL